VHSEKKSGVVKGPVCFTTEPWKAGEKEVAEGADKKGHLELKRGDSRYKKIGQNFVFIGKRPGSIPSFSEP